MAMTLQEQIAAMGGRYGKTIPQLKMMAIKHWEEWRPQMVKRLKEEGTLGYEAIRAAKKTQKEITQLMDQGYKNHEAEEVVMQKYILLKPEQEVIDEMERE